MVERQIDPEHGASTRLALHLDLTSMRLDDLAGDPEAQSHPPVRAPGDRPLEAVEDLGQVLLAHPDALVPDADPRPRRVGLDADLDRLALAELHGVGQQVGDDLVEAGLVPGPADAGRRLDAQLAAGPLGGVPEALGRLPGDAGEVRFLS